MRNLTEIIANQTETKRGSSFIQFGSKKKLSECGILSENQMEVILKLRRTFAFNLHKDNRYLIITTYDKDNKYNFLVVDLTDLSTEDSTSIKNAKRLVMDKIQVSNESTEKKPEDSNTTEKKKSTNNNK